MLWGNRDLKTANTGTVQIFANGLCTGTSTLFQTESKIGEYIIADSKKYLIVRIDSNTSVQVKASTLGAAVAAVGAGNSYVIQQAPAYRDWETDRKSTRLNSSHSAKSRMPSSA